MRKKYFARFLFRVFVLLFFFLLYFVFPETFVVLEKGMFLKRFSVLHILWAIWMLDMIFKLFPIPGTIALGSVKQLKKYYHPAQKTIDAAKFKMLQKKTNLKALYTFAVWCLLGIVIGILWKCSILGFSELFLISVTFYVCDLICVLFWCPFRVWFLKNRCCTTCRIFNWDHFMMFTPMLFMDSFYAKSLVYFAILVFLIWEYRNYRYPERFVEYTNDSLKCKNCTDHLCGRKLSASK